MFSIAGSSLVLIATGSDGETFVDDSQIIDIKNFKKCKTMAPYPLEVWYATGGIVSGSPIICGGQSDSLTNACYKHDNKKNTWQYLASLSGKRFKSASIPLDGALWVTGNENLHLVFLLFVHCVCVLFFKKK